MPRYKGFLVKDVSVFFMRWGLFIKTKNYKDRFIIADADNASSSSAAYNGGKASFGL